MSLTNSREKDQVQMPHDLEAVKILLENAEIDYEEDPASGESDITSITLENGIEFTFELNNLVFVSKP